MKHKTNWFFASVMLLGWMSSACAGTATPAAPVQQEATSAPVVQPTQTPQPAPTLPPTPTPIVAAGDAELDLAFTAFLGSLQKYNLLQDFNELNEMLASDSPPFLLDVRQLDEVEKNGHIEGSVHIPIRELAQHLDLLPSFDTKIVSYCGSGWRCAIAMTVLETLGWQDVWSLGAGSFGGWVKAEFPVVAGTAPEALVLNAASPDPALVMAFDQMLNAIPNGWGVAKPEDLNLELGENQDIVLLDVRTVKEVEAAGSVDVENNINIPLEELVVMRDQWPAAKDTPIVTYCKVGHRGVIAMSILRSYGYTNVRSLQGGYDAWKTAGFATLGGAVDLDSAFKAFLENMDRYNLIMDLAAVNEMLASDAPPFLLDVRQPEEVAEKGHIEGTVNIPLRELAKHTNLLPGFDTMIISYCGTGWRCAIAMTVLETLGWKDVWSMGSGSYGGWVNDGYSIIEGPAPEPVVLNAASPDPALLAEMDKMLSAIPEGWGVVTAENLSSEMIENEAIILLDVRTEDELNATGVIESPNVLHIPLEKFIEMKAEWPAEKNAKIVAYCKAGHRGVLAMTILWSYGYTDVRTLRGGLDGWVTAGFPVAEYAVP